MTSEIKDILENMTTAAPEMEDYIVVPHIK